VIVNDTLTPSTEEPSLEANGESKRQDGGAKRIVLRRQRGALRIRQSEAVAATVVTLLGTAFTVVGLVDLGLLWNPPDFGSSAWEFATLSQTFDSLPMTTLGLGLLAFGFLLQPRSRPVQVRIVAGIFGLAAICLLGLGILYFTVVPEVMRQAPPEAATALNRAIVKNVAEIIIYPVTFASLAVVLWRSVRKIA
jgi:hypothetical protein